MNAQCDICCVISFVKINMKANSLCEQQKTHSETVFPDTLNIFSATHLGSAEVNISERERELWKNKNKVDFCYKKIFRHFARKLIR
jgi:hypothetical protein